MENAATARGAGGAGGAGGEGEDPGRRIEELSALLQESRRERKLFGDVVSHDLLNPVWVAENYVRFALEEPDAARAREFLEGARAALEKTRAILIDARTYLRLQETREPERASVPAAELVAAAAKALRPLWEARRQRVTFAVPEGLELSGSPLLREVLTNLLANAVRYAPEESPIEVLMRAGPPVRIEVRDRGPGVPAEAREEIFRRFERIEKGAISGVGLGLAIVHKVVQLHGGRVWVEDNPGGGAVFVVELP